MLKKIILIISVIIILGGIGLILLHKENTSQKGNEIPVSSSNNKKVASNTNIKNEELVYIAQGKANSSDKGYYYINDGDKKNNIKYFDYSAKKEIYLCNKPNCTHDTEECSSYLDISESNDLFVYNNYLYLISGSGSSQTISITDTDDGDGYSMSEAKGQTPKVYRMNLDGTNKTKIFECPSGVELTSSFIFEGNNLYTFFLKNKTVETGKNSCTSMETDRNLVKINLETKKYEEIFDSKNRSIIGIYKGKIVWEEIVYKENPEKFLNNDDADLKNLRNSTKKIKLFDLSNKTETEVYQDINKNINDIQYEDGKVYFINDKGTKIDYIDLETKKKQKLCDLPEGEASINGIYDNKLQYIYYAGNDGIISKAYYIDLKTKENKEFKLFDKNKYLVEILSENEDFYFVKTGYELGKKYKTWAGTIQQDIEKTNYALIKKEHYWNSKSKYISIENT